MDDVELATLEALEILPERPLTSTERTHKHRRRHRLLADADLINELVAVYGRAVTDGLIEEGFTARAFVRAVRLIDEDLDLWFEATGERLVFRNLGGAERLALDCWLWETHDRARQPERYKPKKSPEHDRPWPNPPQRWAPRRWLRSDIIKALRVLFPGLPLHPLEISVSRALSWERREARARLATEAASDQFHQNSDGEWENTSTTPIAERNHPKPQGFWSVKRDAAADRLIWRDSKWEPYEDDPGPRHVVYTWKPKPSPKIPVELLRDLVQRRVARKRYWHDVKGRPVRPFWWSSRLVRKRLPGDDALDRLATSAAIEAG